MNDSFPLPKLPADTIIDVWQIELDEPLDFRINLDAILSIEEQERAKRFVFSRDASRFRICRAMLRLGLAWYLQMSPREISLKAQWRGKPCLAEDYRLYFNVAHSDGLGLIAFTTAGEVGIDLEAVRRDFQDADVIAANFTAEERSIIAAAKTREEQASIFLRFWTRKEAVMKAAGCGILGALNMVDVSQKQAGVVHLTGGIDSVAGSSWLLRDLELADGFVGAIAAPPGDWSIQQWRIRCEDALQRIGASVPGML